MESNLGNCLTDNEREQVGVDDWLSFERAPIVSHLIAHKDKYENLLFTDLGKKAMSNFMKELTGHLNCRVHIAPGMIPSSTQISNTSFVGRHISMQ